MFSCGLKTSRKRPLRRKFLFLGDHDSGKTCLLTSICIGPFTNQPCRPEVFPAFIADLIVDGIEIEIVPWDICDKVEVTSHPFRYLPYLDSDVILFCFSIDSQLSLQNVETRWLAELKVCRPDGLPTILIGNKKDLRDEHQMKLRTGETSNDRAMIDFVSYEKGVEMATKIGAFAYIECSAKTMEGIHLIFPTAVTSAMQSAAEKVKSFHVFIKYCQNLRCVCTNKSNE